MSDESTRSKKKPAKSPARPGWIGPLFRWELVRLARRGQDARARFILAVALFCVLTAFTLIWFRQTDPVQLFFGEAQTLALSESADFGAAFTLAFLLAQLFILTLLTPAYAAGGIAEEKERKTFDFLLASELTAREIVFGKFFGRVMFLLGILFAGLPILAICQLHGGASIQFLMLSYLVTSCTVIFLSAVSAASAASASTYRGALFRSYGLAAVIVLTGCGVYPLLSPFAIIPALFIMEPKATETFWIVGLGYPLAELVASGLAVGLAVMSIRKLRARMTSLTLRPPSRVLDRYDREDEERARYERRLRDWELLVAEDNERRRLHAEARGEVKPRDPSASGEEELTPEEEHTLSARPVEPAGKQIPVARLSSRQPLIPPRPVYQVKVQPSSRRNRNHTPDYVSRRPRLVNQDPFFWKERYTSGAVRDEDDDAMRAMMYLVGGTISLVVLMFLAISIFSIIVSNGNPDYRVIKWLLLTAGGAGVFVHLLQIGMSATAAICKERQRLTLESLLTIPVSRREILWPKWLTSLTRGLWWGAPAAIVVAFSFLASDVPFAILPAILFFAVSAPFATSYGVWLSLRCPTVNRALMWYLPVAGFLVLVPIGTANWISKPYWLLAFGIVFVLSAILSLGAWVFWRKAAAAFEAETVLGPRG